MVYKLPLVQGREYSLGNIYSIVSIPLMILSIYMFFAGPSGLPGFVNSIPNFILYIFETILFLNGGFALIRPSLAKPDDVGVLVIDDENNKVVIEEALKTVEISFSEINRIDFEIKGAKNLMDNFHGNNNFVEFTYNLFMSKINCEFIIDTPGEMYTIKNAFKKISKANPKVEISYYSE